MLKMVLRIYVIGVFIVSGYVLLTYDQYRLSLISPFDIGVKWPIYAYKNIFKSKLNGDTPENFIKSANKLIESRDEPYEQAVVVSAIFQVMIYDYVKRSPDLTQKEIDHLLNLGITDMLEREYFIANTKNKSKKMDSIDFANQIIKIKNYPRIVSKANMYLADIINLDDRFLSRVAKQLDGFDYDELILKGRESLTKTRRLRAERKPY